MASREENTLILALLLLALVEEEDIEYAKYLYRKLRDQLRRTELLDPMLDELLMRRLHFLPRRYKRRAEEAREIAISVIEGFKRDFEPSILQRFNETEERINSIEQEYETLKSRIDSQRAELKIVKDDLSSYLWLASIGADISRASIRRYLPARIYLIGPKLNRNVLNNVITSIQNFSKSLDLEKADEFPEETGSFWKRLVFKTKQALTHKEVRDKLEMAERAIHVAYLDKPQADANKSQAEAASSLINALKEVSEACIQVGSLLIVKATNNDGKSCIMARTLSPQELKRIEENQSMLRQPQKILEWLQQKKAKRLTSA